MPLEMCLRSKGRIRTRAVPLGVLIGLALVGALVVSTKKGVYTEQNYTSRFNAGKKRFLSLVIAGKQPHDFYKKNASCI